MAAQPTQKIDLNTATRDQLIDELGMRPPQAAALVRHREEQGPFESIDALVEVSGIGPATVEQLRGLATVGAAEPAKKPEPAPAPAPAAKPAEATMEASTKAEVGKIADAMAASQAEAVAGAQAAMDEARERTRAQVQKMASEVEALGERLARKAEADKAAMEEKAASASAGANEIVGLWASYWPEQMKAQFETMQKLAGCKSLPEAIELQRSFAAESAERFNRCLSGSAQLMMSATRLMPNFKG